MEQTEREKGDTWPKILKFNFERYGDRRRAMRRKHFGVWQPHTWKDYFNQVKYLALGLLSFGFKPGDKLLIIGDNAPEWYHAQLAAQANRGVSVGLFSDLQPSEIRQMTQNCDARFAVVEGQEQVDKLLQIKAELPLLEKIVFWNYKGLAHYDQQILTGYREVLQVGEDYETRYPGIFEENVAAGKADDICAIVYTAGTTGDVPKGAVHTFRTLRAGADYLLRLDAWTQHDNVVPYLPPVWINEQWIGVGCHLLSAAVLNFAETSETQQRDSSESGPSVVFYGARLWESQAATVHARIREADVLKRLIFRWLMPVGYQAADRRYRGQTSGLLQRVLYGLADRILFRSIKSSLGLSNARICYSTGSMLSPDAFRFYHALDLPLKSLYSTTEGGILSGAANEDIHFETVGPVFEGAELKTGVDGELRYRQPGTFVGYYKDPEGTAAVLDDGYFKSGDSGFVRDDGQLVFRDRVGDLVSLPGGVVVAPQYVESRLRFSPYIKDAWVMSGQQGDYLAAVIVIEYDTVSRWAGQKRVSFTSFAELSQSPEVIELVGRDVERINQTLPEGGRVRKYVNLHREFDPDAGELTRKRNLRRTFLAQRFSRLVDAIYGDMEAMPIQKQKEQGGGRAGAVDSLRIQPVKGAVR